MENTLLIFDSADVEYLANHFTVDQLRHEIKQAKTKGRMSWEWKEQMFDTDFIRACQLAITVKEPIAPRKQDYGSKTESIESIKSRYNLVDYIEQYIKLRKVGDKYAGLCPFHADKKSPSLYIYPNNTYHCFGCQVHGTIIDFVMQYNKVDIKEAISILSR